MNRSTFLKALAALPFVPTDVDWRALAWPDRWCETADGRRIHGPRVRWSEITDGDVIEGCRFYRAGILVDRIPGNLVVRDCEIFCEPGEWLWAHNEFLEFAYGYAPC